MEDVLCVDVVESRLGRGGRGFGVLYGGFYFGVGIPYSVLIFQKFHYLFMSYSFFLCAIYYLFIYLFMPSYALQFIFGLFLMLPP